MASIRKRTLPSGKVVWQCDYKDQHGKRRSRQFDRKKDADGFMVSARGEVAKGTYIDARTSPTVGAAADLWLKHCETRRDAGLEMEAATYEFYEGIVRLHIKDADLELANAKLADLRRPAITQFRDRCLSSGGRTVVYTRKILSILSIMLKWCQGEELIITNPVDGVRVHRDRRVETPIEPPSPQGVRKLVDAADADCRPMLLVAAIAGLRASELRGLTWANVDLAAGYIRVRQRADKYGAIGEVKSQAGYRDVPIGPALVAELKRWKLRAPISDLGLVFPNRKGAVLALTDIHRLHFKPLCREAGVSCRWHDLRHHAISMWIAQGFGVKAVMEFAGHSDYRMTMERYGHLFPSPEHHDGMASVESRLLG